MYKWITLLILYFPLLHAQYAETPFPKDFPNIAISTPQEAGHGIYLLSNYCVTPQPISTYLLQLNSSGMAEFYRKLDSAATDFKLQPNGNYTYFDVKAGKFYEMSEKFRIIDSFYAKGYATNDHELQILPNGHYFLIADEIRTMDLSSIVPGGSDTAQVLGNIIQEFDENKDLVFQWNSFDYFKVTDAADDILLIGKVVDFVHTNSIELDTDGNLLISSRNVDEITKIERRTGKIMWRLGGKNNEFGFVGDRFHFSHQHDVRRLKNGNILLFDNGNGRYPQFSRVVEYQIDERKKKAILVWEYRHSPEIFSSAMGSAQRLPNGNTVIGWGFNVSYSTNAYLIAATEVTKEKNTVFEMTLPMFNFSYRVFHYDSPTPGNDSTEKITSVKESLYRESEIPALSIFPNPVSSNATVKFRLKNAASASIQLFDALGKEVSNFVEKGTTTENAGTAMITVKNLSSGVYFLRVNSGDEGLVKKLIVSKQ